MAADGPGPPVSAHASTAAERAAADVGGMVAAHVREAIAEAERSAQEMRQRALGDASADREAVHRAARLVLARIDVIEARVAQILQDLRDEATRIAADVNRPAPTAQAPDAPAEPEPEPKPQDRPMAAPAAHAPIDAEPVASDVIDAADDDGPAPADAADGQAAVEGSVDEPDATTDDGPVSADDAATPVAALPDPPRPAVPRRRSGLLGRLLPSAPATCAVCGRTRDADDGAPEAWTRSGRVSLCPECRAAGWRLPERGTIPYRSTHPAHPA